MPTPFMHMAVAHQLLGDPALRIEDQELLRRRYGAFLLGNVAPDARVSSGLQRAQTHFFEYAPVINPPAGTAMLNQHPMLLREHCATEDQVAFIAGYLAHLAMDEVWCTDLLYPGFNEKWGTNTDRFHMLHMLLATLDERDRAKLPESDYPALHDATPHQWLPFMGDADLSVWRDIVADQLAPNGKYMTRDIFSKRISMTEDQIADFIHSPDLMQEQLWKNVPKEFVARVEAAMYAAARTNIINYLAP